MSTDYENASMLDNDTSAQPMNALAKGLYSTLLTVIMFLIIVGNAIVLLVLYRQRKQSNLRVTNIFLANLAVVDLSIGLLMFPFSIATVIEGAWVFGDSVCQMNGFINMTAGTCSILTMAMISIDRYRAIVSRPGNKLQVNQTLVLLGVIWFWGVLIGILPVLGWNEYAFGSYGSICKMTFDKGQGYILFAAITCFAVPLVVMFYCYLRVFLKVRNHRKLLLRWRRPSMEFSKENRSLKTETRTAKIVFTVLFVFAAAWTPFVIVHVIQASPNINLTSGVITSVTLFAAMHSFYNPIIYITMNRKFRADMLELVPVLRMLGQCCECCCCCRQRASTRVDDLYLEANSSSAAARRSKTIDPNITKKLHALGEGMETNANVTTAATNHANTTLDEMDYYELI